MKIIINRCHGGFGLSFDAEKLYAEKKGFELFCYMQTAYNHREGYAEYTRIDNPENNIFYHTFKKDFGEFFRDWSDEIDDAYFSSRDIERNDPVLIEVIEELGSEKASGKYSELSVVEIPDDVEWEINEYDGLEWIAESHRTWR